jgi:hypothetical protein
MSIHPVAMTTTMTMMTIHAANVEVRVVPRIARSHSVARRKQLVVITTAPAALSRCPTPVVEQHVAWTSNVAHPRPSAVTSLAKEGL